MPSSSRSHALFTPVTLGAFELPHRIVMAPMTRLRADDTFAPTELVARYYAERSSAALIVTESIMVAPHGDGYGNLPGIAQDITTAFSPLGPAAVQWAMNVAWCESRYHPNSVNSDSGASGLFQFLPSTWAFTPEHALSPFDPAANAKAAAWLYARDGPSQWVCQG